MIVKVYLDLCAIQRPLDTPNQIRIAAEAEAVLGIITLCEKGLVELVASEALVYEAERNTVVVRHEHAKAVLAKASTHVNIDSVVRERAAKFAQDGIKPLDALHLALAEASKADYFCTCDDQLLRKASKSPGIQVKIVSPLDLIQEIQE